jgi:pimeloyl-ACP methyl ester carboxylesterase
MSIAPQLLCIPSSTGRRIAAVLERASGAPERPLVVVAPAFEHTIRNSLVIAHYFLQHGFDVLRYDARNHVGRSDGNIEDFTLHSAMTDMVDVVRFARHTLGAQNISLVATSLAGRVAMRAGRELAGELKSIASIACVLDVRATVAAAAKCDGIGKWLTGRVTDPNESWKVVKNRVKYSFCKSAIEENWHTLESALADAAALGGLPFFDVHGERDPWVSTRDVLTLAEQSKSVEVVVLGGGVHELNAATSRLGLCHLVRAVVRHAQGRVLSLEDMAEPSWEALVALNKRERLWERTPLDQWNAPFSLGVSA